MADRRLAGLGKRNVQADDNGSQTAPPAQPRLDDSIHPLGLLLRPSRANIGEQIVNLARCDSRDHDGERVHVGRALLAFRTSGRRDCSLWEAEAERKSALAARRWVDDVPEPRIGSLESPFLRRRGI